MTPIKAEDKPKIIGLGSAVAIVFLVGGINVIRSMGGGGAAAPAAAPSVSSTATALASTPPASSLPAAAAGQATITENNSATGAAVSAHGPRTAADILAIQHPDYGADPFRPITSTKLVDVPIPGFAPPVITQVPSPPLLLPPPSPGRPNAAPPLLPAPVVIPLRLTGVIGGNDALALIADGVTEHFLHRGDTFQNYTVVQIDEDSVTLRHGDVGKVLRVGAGDPEIISFASGASAPAKPETKVVATKPAAETTRETTASGTLLTKAAQNGQVRLP